MESHGSVKRIDSEKLGLAYDHIKDFRNICAHDERFTAPTSPRQATVFRDLCADLEIVLTAKDRAELMRSTCDLMESIEGSIAPQVDVATRTGWSSLEGRRYRIT